MKIDIDFSEDNHILTRKHALTLLKCRNFIGVSGVVIHLNSKQLGLNGFFFNLMKGLHEYNINSLYVKGCNPTTYKMFKQARIRFEIYKEGELF